MTLQLQDGAKSQVALQYTGKTTVDLRTGPVTLALKAKEGTTLQFQVPAENQPAAGEALLAISSPNLGTRWLIPVSAQPGSYAGLWVGDVVVNDVSEARLGATDFANDLAVALVPAAASTEASVVRGSAQIHETVAGVNNTLTFTVSLALPDLPVETGEQVIPAPPYVRGYVFVDLNQNGQRDAGEPGLPGAQVRVGKDSPAVTAADGSWVLQQPADTPADIAVSGAATVGYTTAFSVTLPAKTVGDKPAATINATPAQIMLSSGALSSVTPSKYLTQALGQATLPYYDLRPATGSSRL